MNELLSYSLDWYSTAVAEHPLMEWSPAVLLPR
jgi:hypothetical protein